MTNTAYKRIKYERDKAFKAQDKRGHSKHFEKIALKEAAHATGLSCPQVRGLFSDGTFATYIKQSDNFIDYVDSTGADVKHLEDCRKFIRPYFETMTEKGLSSWTIHTRMFALAAVFQCDEEDFSIDLPKRQRKDIKRTRNSTQSITRFLNEKYDNIKTFIIATGTRRGGMQKLKKNDLIVKPGGDILIHLDEKGGKERWALVLPEYSDFVKNTFERSPGYGPHREYLFPKGYIPDSMAVHCYRAVYAQKLYQLFENRGLGNGNKYYCRKDMKGKSFDKGLLIQVSRNMGHNRCDVIVENYFYKVDNSKLPNECVPKSGEANA